MPGLLGGIARTVVIAGTATAVSGRVQRHQAEKFADRDSAIYAQHQQAYDQQYAYDQQRAAAPYGQAPPQYGQAQYAPPPGQYAPPPPQYSPPPAPATDTMTSQLEHLGQLRNQGILTEEEFVAAKAKVLGI